MRCGYIQFNVSHNKEENFRHIREAMQKFQGDLVVLPELCMCGYLFRNRDALLHVAEDVPFGTTTQKMMELSATYGCIIVFGLAEIDGDFVYNTAVVVGNGKYFGKYRKIHLSDLEKKFFKRGESNVVFDVGVCKIGIQICFDLWFPEVSREQVKQGANILIALANYGGETTGKIAQIRAIENITPLIVCNRVGTEYLPEMDAYFLGKSQILNQYGECIGVSLPDMETVETAVLEIERKHSNVICSDFDAEINLHPIYE